jgi:heptosyltransferase-2
MTGGPTGERGAGRADTLVIQTAFLGDVVLTTPLLAALAARHGRVDVVTTPAAAPLLETHPAVAAVHRYDKRGADRGLGGIWRVGRGLRARGYARVVLPHRSWRSAALAVLSGAPDRIGFGDAPAAVSYTRRVRRPERGHEVERLLTLAESPDPAPPVHLELTADDRAAADEWLRARDLGPGFVAMAPGSIWGTKRWPGYPELAAALGTPIVVIGGPEDGPLADAVVAAAPGRAHSAAGRLSLRASAALVARAAVLITNDSLPLHLATAVGTPVVALFGPTVTAFGFGPRGPRDRVVEHLSLDCRPCSTHGPATCPLGHHRCMREVSVEAVAAAVAAASGVEGTGAIRTGH